MRVLFLLILLTGCGSDSRREQIRTEAQTASDKAWEENRRFQQELITLCRQKGGVPVVSMIGKQLQRCDFPWPSIPTDPAAPVTRQQAEAYCIWSEDSKRWLGPTFCGILEPKEAK